MSKGYKLISAILRDAWLIDDRAIDAHMPLLIKLLNGELEDLGATATLLVTARNSNAMNEVFSAFDNAPQGSTAIIPIEGTLMKADFCGTPGTDSLAAFFKAANEHPNISSIVLKINSGGGAVQGTQEFANLIKASVKSTVAYVDGLAASAAYWLASACDRIVLSSETAIVGSIGVAMTIRDYSKRLEEAGIKEHTITATLSSDKNQAHADALESKYETIRKEMLDPINSVFHAAVKTNRDGKLKMDGKEPLTGKTYLAEKAISLGLADSIGTMDEAIAQANQLAQSQATKQPTNTTNMKVKFLSGLTALVAYFGFAAKAGETHVEGEISEEKWKELNASLEQLNTVKAELATANTALTTAQSDLEKSQSDLTAANTKVTDLTTERDGLKAKIDAGAHGSFTAVIAKHEASGKKVDKDILSPEDEELARMKTDLGN